MSGTSSTVLVYLEKDNKFLMLFRNKEKNDINKGKWIGVGGHIEAGESKEAALIRVVKEETGLDLHSYKYLGKVHFIDTGVEEMMYVFHSKDFSGELIECDEGHLEWIDKDKLPSLPMWEGDYLFLNKVLNPSDKLFNMEIRYDHGHLVDHKEE